MIQRIKRVIFLISVGLVLLLGMGSVVIRLSLLEIESYKTALENKVLELTTIPIEIGSLRANFRGFSPEIILQDIRVLTEDEQAESPIKLEEVRIGVNPIQLLLTRELLPSSWLTLVGAKLSIARKEDGSLSIVGLNAGDSEQPYWMLQGGRYEVLKSEITWLDEQRHGTSLKFDKVDLLIKNEFDAQRHEIHLISQLPKQVGKTLRVSMSIQGDVFETDAINGIVYVEATDIQLPELLTGKKPLGIKIQAGEGSFKTWSKFQHSKLISLIGSLQAKNLVLNKGRKNQKPLQIISLSTEFNGTRSGADWQLGVADFDLQIGDKTWPTAGFSLSADEQFSRFSGSITQLDLQEMMQLFGFFMPKKSEKYDLISKLDLKGMLTEFSFFVDSSNDQFAVSGVFDHVFTNAYAGLPELENLSGSIKGSNEKGVIALNTKKGSLFYREVFRKPFIINRLSGLLQWQQMPDKWQVSSESLVLDTKDIQIQSRVALTIPKNNDAAVFMDLQASFANAQDVSYAPEYYPVSIMDKDLLNWLDNAFVSGKLGHGDLLVYGELDKFPFSNGHGAFEVMYNLLDVELHVHPEWPNLKNVAADLLFLKNSVSIDISHAEVNNLQVKRALVEVPSFSESNHLLVKGQVNGRIVDGLTYLQHTPLSESADNVLDVIVPVGLTQVKLDLKIPLVETAEVVVDGIAHLNKARLTVKSADLNITAVKGDLKFTEKGLYSDTIKAKALAYPVEIKVATDALNTSVTFSGKTDILQLRKQFGFLDNEFIEQRIKGLIAYQVKLDLPGNRNEPAELNINTNLLGVLIDLPGSLKKSAKQQRPFFVSLLINDDDLLPVTLNYNDELKAAIQMSKQQSAMHSAHLVYGKGTAVPPLGMGIDIAVEQDFIDASEWMEFVKLGANEEQKAEENINSISINIKQLQWNNKNQGAFEIAMQRVGQQWQGNLSCAAAKGAFVLPRNYTGKDAIMLDMAYLNLSELMQAEMQEDSLSVEEMPLINVLSEQLWWKGVDLGKLEIKTERLVDGVRFNYINVIADDHNIELKADWIKKDQGFVTEMSGSLSADDFGGFLSKIGFPNDLKDSGGKVEYEGIWQGAPYQLSLQKMDAEIDLEFTDGRISSIEPGFGRILGLLAMEQWVKRLTLDFSDLYEQGLSFNSITGHYSLNEGKAVTKDLMVDAITARIAIEGEADLLAETLDKNVVVVPKSSGAVPIAGTIVSSIAGTITQVLTRDYKEGYFFGSKYRITGKWDDIEVTTLHEHDGVLKKTWKGLTDFSWMKSTPQHNNK
ncbi:MAG: YhdP family protein [Methylococcaceae bacterium]